MRILSALTVAAALLSGCANSNSSTLSPAAVKQPKFSSSKPLYLNVAFGQKAERCMLIVLDESKGDGAGYDVAYVDDNLDGDLTNHQPKAFPAAGRPDARSNPTISFTAPRAYKDTTPAEYSLNLYSLAGASSKIAPAKDLHFFWDIRDAEQWNYFFINGKFHVYPTAAEALKGEPIRIGSKCDWEITAQQNGENVALSVGLKDANGCTLRIVRSSAGEPAPTITVLDKSGKALVKDQKLGFG